MVTHSYMLYPDDLSYELRNVNYDITDNFSVYIDAVDHNPVPYEVTDIAKGGFDIDTDKMSTLHIGNPCFIDPVATIDDQTVAIGNQQPTDVTYSSTNPSPSCPTNTADALEVAFSIVRVEDKDGVEVTVPNFVIEKPDDDDVIQIHASDQTATPEGEYTVYYYSFLDGESDMEFQNHATERSFKLTIEADDADDVCDPELELPNLSSSPYKYKIGEQALSIDMTGIDNNKCQFTTEFI